MNVLKMLNYLFAFVIFVHGAIHLLGFVKAFRLANIDHQLKADVSKPAGVLWLIGSLLFFSLTLLYLWDMEGWAYVAFAAVMFSQVMVFAFWIDAKAASLINLLIVSIAVISYAGESFEGKYLEDVDKNLIEFGVKKNSIGDAKDIITMSDLEHLPLPVKSYLQYAGVVGKQKVKGVKTRLTGEMRSRSGDWFRFHSEQHNFFDSPTRLFFMKARVSGLPAYGYHYYEDQSASMQIKLLSLFPVSDVSNEKLYKAETVTIFNDMCIMAPATLISDNISWKAISDTSAEATFTNRDIRISATLYFNSDGQLTNFVSDDRYEISDMKKYRFSTPVSKYKKMNGYNLPTYGEAIWHFPEGPFTYGKFNITVQEVFN